MKRWSSCLSSHGVLAAELAGLYLIPLPNPVPWASADHSLHLMFITDSYWTRTGASLFLLCILLAQLRTGVFYPGSPADMSHSSEQRNKGAELWPAHLCSAEAITSSLSLRSFQFLGFACVPGLSQWAAIPWKSLLLAWDRVAVGSTSLDLLNCLPFSVVWIQLLIRHCRRGVGWQSSHADLQARLKVFCKHSKFTREVHISWFRGLATRRWVLPMPCDRQPGVVCS